VLWYPTQPKIRLDPDFLFRSVALANFLRLPLREAAYVAAVVARCRKSGSAPVGTTILYGNEEVYSQTKLSSHDPDAHG
jgi:hypothetical protein